MPIRMEALTQHQLIAARIAASHDTELELAELLCSDRFKDSQDYHSWGRMSPYCFDGRTVEQVAEGTQQDSTAFVQSIHEGNK